MKNTVTIEGIGPIRNPFEIEFDSEGGIVVLEGLNESGKSTALKSTRALLGSGEALQHTDGFDRGSVLWNGGEARITVAKQTRSSGKIGVARLEGVDPMALVDPGIKDPEKADDERIRVLALLTGVKLDATPFAKLVGGEEALKLIARAGSYMKTSPVDMVKAFKSDFQDAARKLKEQAKNEGIKAEGIRKLVGEVDTEAPHNEAELASAHRAAVERETLARGRAQEARGRAQRIAEAGAKLEEFAKGRGGISSVEARSKFVEAEELLQARAAEESESQIRLTEARAAYQAAEKAAQDAQLRTREARKAVQDAAQTVKTAQAAEESLEAARVLAGSSVEDMGPSDEELAALTRSADAAAKRMQVGAIVRDALRKLTDAEKCERTAQELLDEAARFDEAAEGCEEILTLEIQAKSPRGLRVRGGRLVVSSPRSPEEIFAERSAGARTKIAVDIAIDAIGEGGLLVLSQEAFEGLDPVARRELHDHLRSRKTSMLTAACSDGPLRATPFDPNA